MVMRCCCCSLALVVVGCGFALIVPPRCFAEESAAADLKSAESSNRERVRKTLDVKLSIDFVETPLGDVAAFLQEKLKVNVQLDNKALEDAGTGTDTPITRRLTDVTARSVLNLMLGGLDLTYVVDDGVLVITTPEKASNILYPIAYSVDEFIHGTNEFGEPIQDYDWLIDLITSTTMPTTWDDVGGPASIAAFDGTLVVTQTADVHQVIAPLLAKIRELKSTPIDTPQSSHIGVDDRERANDPIRKKLDQIVALEFVETPFVDVAQHLSELLHVNVEFDIKALEDAGTGSDTPVTFRIKDVTAAAAMKLMLEQLDLTFIVTNEVLLITTPEKSCSELVLNLYPVRDFVSHAADRETAFGDLIKTIIATVGPTTWDKVGGPGAIEAVPVADAILVSQTWEVQQQIEQLMAQLRASRTIPDHRAGEQVPALETRIYRLATFVPTRQQTEKDHAAESTYSEPTPFEVLELLQKLVEPQSWKKDKVFVQVLGNKLIIRQQSAIHRKIERVLKKIQQADGLPAGTCIGFFIPSEK